MKEEDFDQCPNCAGYGIFGLRIHPKFSTCYSGTTGGEPDMVMAHVHGEDRFLMGIGCLGCAGVPTAEILEEGVNVIRSAGWSMAKPN